MNMTYVRQYESQRLHKVLHGAESDIVWLQQDFNLYIVNLFDTYHASRALSEVASTCSYATIKLFFQISLDMDLRLCYLCTVTSWRINDTNQRIGAYGMFVSVRDKTYGDD